MEEKEQIIDYNEEPVYYCSHCLSLKIRNVACFDMGYCDECGSTDIDSTDIHSWENQYFTRFGHKYLDKY